MLIISLDSVFPFNYPYVTFAHYVKLAKHFITI